MVVGGLTVILWKQGSGGIFELYEMVPGVIFSAVAIVVVSLSATSPMPQSRAGR
jgi:sodium/proline symporter